MAEHYEQEEEEFSTQFNGKTLRRIVNMQKPYKWRVGLSGDGGFSFDAGCRLHLHEQTHRRQGALLPATSSNCGDC